MQIISDTHKSKLAQFIESNDLDYDIVDNGISKPHVIAYDGIKFFLYENGSEFVITKYDKNKDNPNNPGYIPYEYFTFKSFPQVLEQLSFYDRQISKTFWMV